MCSMRENCPGEVTTTWRKSYVAGRMFREDTCATCGARKFRAREMARKGEPKFEKQIITSNRNHLSCHGCYSIPSVIIWRGEQAFCIACNKALDQLIYKGEAI